MPLLVFGLSLAERQTPGPKISFNLPLLAGWPAPESTSRIEIFDVIPTAGTGTVSFQLTVKRKIGNRWLTLKIAFTIPVELYGAEWRPRAGAVATGGQTLQATTASNTAAFELDFGLFDIKNRAGHSPKVQFNADATGELLCQASPLCEVLDPAAIGPLRLRIADGQSFQLRLDGTPRLRFPQGSLSVVPLLVDGQNPSRTLALLPHLSTTDLEFELDLPLANTLLTIYFEPPVRSDVPEDEHFRLPLGAYIDSKEGIWKAPMGLVGYALRCEFQVNSRILQSLASVPSGNGNGYRLWFMQCVDGDGHPLLVYPVVELPLCVSVRRTSTKVQISRLSIAPTSQQLTLYRYSDGQGRRYHIPISGPSLCINDWGTTGYVGDLVGVSISATPYPYSGIGPSVRCGDIVHFLSTSLGSFGLADIAAEAPYHAQWMVLGCEKLQSYSLSSATTPAALPVCGLEVGYAGSAGMVSMVCNVLDMALAEIAVGGADGGSLEQGWATPAAGLFSRKPDSATSDPIKFASYFSVPTGQNRTLKLASHHVLDKTSWLETLRPPSRARRGVRAPANDRGFFSIRSTAELTWRPATEEAKLDDLGAFVLPRDFSSWFRFPRPSPADLPYAIVKTKPNVLGLGTLLDNELRSGHAYGDIVKELNDIFRFPQHWTGVVLLEVLTDVGDQNGMSAVFGTRINFRYVAFCHQFDADSAPGNSFVVTKAFAHPPDVSVPATPVPGPHTRINARYFIESRTVLIVNRAVTQLDLRASLTLYSFLGVPLRANSTGKPLDVKVVGHYAPGKGFAISGDIPVSGVEATLGAISQSSYWPFESLRITGLTVMFALESTRAVMKILLRGQLGIRESFGKIIGRKKNEPLVFESITLVSGVVPTLKLASQPRKKSLDTLRAVDEQHLTWMYDTARWAINTLDFSLGSRPATLHFEGMAYSLSGVLSDDYPGMLPLESSDSWTTPGYAALSFKADLQIPGGSLVGVPGLSFQLLIAWELISGTPGSKARVGLRFAGLREFIVPLFPGVSLQAEAFDMGTVAVPGTAPLELAPWFTLVRARIRSNWGSLISGKSISVGLFLRSNGERGFAALYEDPANSPSSLRLRWLLFAQNLSLPPGQQWARDLLQPTKVGTANIEDPMVKQLKDVLDVSRGDALQPVPASENFIGKWLIGGGVDIGSGLLGAKFFHQDGAFSGITLDGPLVDALLGGRAITLTYKPGRTTDADQYEAIVDLPSVAVSGFEAKGGQFRVRLSPSGDFLLDGAYPFPDERGFRNWDRATALAIGTFKAMGGFYIARYRGKDLDLITTASGDVQTRLSFGAAAAWGKNWREDSNGWFRGEVFIGYFGFFEGTLRTNNNSLHLERLTGGGGVLLTAKATVTLWIISARLSLRAYAQLMVDYRAPELLFWDCTTCPSTKDALALKSTNTTITVSATLAVSVSFDIEIDFWLGSYTIRVSSTYVVNASHTFNI